MALLQSAVALVFGLAVVGKLRDRSGFEQSVQDFGVPSPFAPTVAATIVAAEAILAVGVLFAVSASVAAATGAVLVALFTVGIVRQLLKGQRPNCRCFGQLGDSPIGWTSVGRNVAIISLMVAVAVRGRAVDVPRTILDGVDEHPSTVAILGAQALLLVAGLVGFRLIRQGHQELRSAIEHIDVAARQIERVATEAEVPAVTVGLPIGALAPSFEVRDVDRRLVPLDAVLRPDRPLVLLFVSSTCGSCRELKPEVETWRQVHGDRATIIEVFADAGTEETGRPFVAADDGSIAGNYRAEWTPAALVIGPDGRIAHGLVYGTEAIIDLVFDVVSDTLARPTELGRLAPPLDPQSLVIAPGVDLESRERLYIFWNSDCPFCQQLAPELANQSDTTGPAIVFVTRRADLVIETVGHSLLIDADDSLGQFFGSPGTPSAVLTDGEGRQLSSLVVGPDDIRHLLGPAPNDLDQTIHHHQHEAREP